MVNEQMLVESMVALVQTCKQQSELIARITSEFVALRETVRGLDPTFGDVLAQKRVDHSAQAVMDETNRLLDELARRLRESLIV
jgi:hypothetical protein